MKKQKAILWFVSIILVLSTLSFSACGNNEEGQDEVGEIQVGTDNNAGSESTDTTPGKSADELFAELENQMFIDAVTEDSIGFHLFMKNPENFGLTSIEPTWGRYYTIEYAEEAYEYNFWIKERLDEIDVNELTNEGDVILYKTLKQNLELSMKYDEDEENEFYYYGEPFSIFNGDYINTPLVMAEFEFRKKEDIDTYIALLKLYDEYIGRQINYEKEKSELGLFMPDFVLDMVIEQCEKMIKGADNGKHYLFATFNERIDAIEWLDDEQKANYKEENKLALTEHFFPVYDKIIEELETLRGTGSDKLNDAQREHFLLRLQSNTSSNFDPEFIIKALDEELYRSLYLMYVAYNMNEKVEDLYHKGALSKGSVEEDMDYIKSIYTSVFPELPAHDLDMQVLPDSMSFLNSAAYFVISPLDDYTRNIIRINPSSAKNDPEIMYILAHEGYGGHLMQSVYNGSNDIGNLRRIISSTCYEEGLSSYGASCILKASDFDEPLALYGIGYSNIDMVLGARIEMGIFYEGWTTREVGLILKDLWGLDLEKDSEVIQGFYERMFASKGTMCRYGFGVAFFNKLRDAAEKEFEDERARAWESFDVVGFNTRILEIGPCHLNLLEEMLGYMVSQEEEEEEPKAA